MSRRISEKELEDARRLLLNRRRLLGFGGAGVSSLLVSGGPLALLGCTPQSQSGKKSGDSANAEGSKKKRFLFVFGAMGGASINDSFLAVRQSESKNAGVLNAYPDSLVKGIEGSDLRGIDVAFDDIGPLPFKVKTMQSQFLSKYYRDIMVATVTGTSVSHPVGQFRSITGNEAWNGRTLQEAVAAQYGKDLLLPNINMSTVGFAENGKDVKLPRYAVAEPVPDPNFYPFGLHGYKGIQGAPDEKLIGFAREVRNNKLEPQSAFLKTFGGTPAIQEWLKYRSKQNQLEDLDLINKLNAAEDSKDFRFSSYGLSANKNAEVLRDVFPDLGADPLQTQALLAYLLVTEGLTCSVTFGLGMNVTLEGTGIDDAEMTNTPTAFDYSHNAHRATQALLWNRIFDTIDRLISLLKTTEYMDGESYWDNSMIYIATEFGRDKSRPEGKREFTSGHHTNNGVAIISPLANGGRVLGGVDPDTLLTYGFDPETGDPVKKSEMAEKHIYAGILQALGVDTSDANLPDMRAMRKKA